VSTINSYYTTVLSSQINKLVNHIMKLAYPSEIPEPIELDDFINVEMNDKSIMSNVIKYGE